MDLLNKILSFLPFNGDKTKLSIIVTILGILQTFFPQYSILSTIATFITTHLLAVGATGLAVGVTHKVVKAESSDPKQLN